MCGLLGCWQFGPTALFLVRQKYPMSAVRIIYSSDYERRTDFEHIVAGEYMDFKFLLDTARRELFEAIKEGTITK